MRVGAFSRNARDRSGLVSAVIPTSCPGGHVPTAAGVCLAIPGRAWQPFVDDATTSRHTPRGIDFDNGGPTHDRGATSREDALRGVGSECSPPKLCGSPGPCLAGGPRRDHRLVRSDQPPDRREIPGRRPSIHGPSSESAPEAPPDAAWPDEIVPPSAVKTVVFIWPSAPGRLWPTERRLPFGS